MNPIAFPIQGVIWCIAIAAKCVFMLTVLPRKYPPLIVAFATWAFVKAVVLFTAALLGNDTGYYVVYWGGQYIFDLLGAGLGLSLGGRLLLDDKRPLQVPALAGKILLPLYAVTALLLWMRKGGGLETGNSALQLWVFGSLLILWLVTKTEGTDRVLMIGLIVLFGAGWVLAGWLLFLAPHWTPSRAAYVGIDCAIDAAVFGWWAWEFRR